MKLILNLKYGNMEYSENIYLFNNKFTYNMIKENFMHNIEQGDLH